MARRADGAAERLWRERLRRYRLSTTTVVEFCEREGVSTAAFYAWKRRLEGAAAQRRRTSPPTAPPPLFVPVSVRSAAGGLRIELPGGAVIQIAPSTDERLVEMCLQAALELRHAAEGQPC
ncbi:MAG TPA: hypothetical protein VGK58_14635 [Lacipirellulaceae bacterium]|jgi:hypothetical protein